MRLDGAAHLHHGASSRSRPARISSGRVASHSASMRITAANSAAHWTCQPTVTVAAPGWRSSEISGEATTAFCTAMNWPPCRALSAAWLPVPAFDNSHPRAASANHIGVQPVAQRHTEALGDWPEALQALSLRPATLFVSIESTCLVRGHHVCPLSSECQAAWLAAYHLTQQTAIKHQPTNFGNQSNTPLGYSTLQSPWKGSC